MTQPPPQNHLLIQFEKITRELWEWIDRENKRLQEELQEEAKVSCRCGHKESEHKSLDSRPFGKWNCTQCQCKEFQHDVTS